MFLSLRACVEGGGKSQENVENYFDGTSENLREYVENMREYEEICGKYEKIWLLILTHLRHQALLLYIYSRTSDTLYALFFFIHFAVVVLSIERKIPTHHLLRGHCIVSTVIHFQQVKNKANVSYCLLRESYFPYISLYSPHIFIFSTYLFLHVFHILCKSYYFIFLTYFFIFSISLCLHILLQHTS